MTDLSIAERLYKRHLHSEQDRQEEIQRRAARIEQHLVSVFMKSDSEALEIAGDILGFMEPEVMMHILRCNIRGGAAGLAVSRQFSLNEFNESVKRIAEHRAIKEVEALTPEDFE